MKALKLDIENYSTEPEDLLAYGFDASGLAETPSAVAWPKSVEEVASLMRQADREMLAVIPRGAGTGMSGGAVPARGALVLSMERMNKILEIGEENLTALVEPGVINGHFQRELEGMGLFYPPDPASMEFCTLGGNVAENAGGPRALKYGVTRDYVLGLEAVLPNGSIINTGVQTRKGVVGYDLTRLLVGSEGTLAVITKIRLKILPLPEDVLTLLVLFKDLRGSGEAVSRIIASKIIPRTLEFMDNESIRAVENYHPIGLPKNAQALLLIELDGHPEAIKNEAREVVEICEALGADVTMAEDDRARETLWRARRGISPALYHVSPKKVSEDIVVPRSKISEMLSSLKELSKKSGIPIAAFGHAGDGNIHVNLLPPEKKDLSPVLHELFESVLKLGGTISGEHGIGLAKKPFIEMEIKPAELKLMRDIKAVFDPKGILNPKKIFP
jgi:glycolate oxidase